MLIHQILRFIILAFKNELPDFRQNFFSIGIIISRRVSGPNGIFIELNFFLGMISKNHGAQAAIANRQTFNLLYGRLIVSYIQ